MKETTVTLTKNGEKILVPYGIRLSDALSFGHHSFSAPCGGHGKCGKCRVTAHGALSPVSEAERNHLTTEELAQGVRLACLTRLFGDAEVFTEHPLEASILSYGISQTHTLRPRFSRYGAAIDIGTTTLAAKLYDVSGNELASVVRLNPQSSFGADVISRIEASLDGKADALAATVRSALDEMLTELAKAAGISAFKIDRAVITGNTAMLYFLTERNPESLSRAPFCADHLFGETLTADDLALSSLAPETPIDLPPSVSAFVGADTTCALLAAGIPEKHENALLTDIGTNGEMALCTDGQLTVCSTAAGPAFEGVGISMGMRGETGAIDTVNAVNGSLHAHIIGNVPPRGICGSGLVDAIACLLQTEELDETGFLEDGDAVISSPVVLTQKDIRSVQLAKSAICAGLLTLLHHAEKTPNDVDMFYVAGGFGSYLNMQNAEVIGLIPKGLAKKSTVIGNAALAGASMLLLDETLWAHSEEIAKNAEVLSLATDTFFMDQYVEQMMF